MFDAFDAELGIPGPAEGYSQDGDVAFPYQRLPLRRAYWERDRYGWWRLYIDNIPRFGRGRECFGRVIEKLEWGEDGSPVIEKLKSGPFEYTDPSSPFWCVLDVPIEITMLYEERFNRPTEGHARTIEEAKENVVTTLMALDDIAAQQRGEEVVTIRLPELPAYYRPTKDFDFSKASWVSESELDGSGGPACHLEIDALSGGKRRLGSVITGFDHPELEGRKVAFWQVYLDDIETWPGQLSGYAESVAEAQEAVRRVLEQVEKSVRKISPTYLPGDAPQTAPPGRAHTTEMAFLQHFPIFRKTAVRILGAIFGSLALLFIAVKALGLGGMEKADVMAMGPLGSVIVALPIAILFLGFIAILELTPRETARAIGNTLPGSGRFWTMLSITLVALYFILALAGC